MSNDLPVNRRNVLRSGLWLAGGVAAAGPLAALLSACGSDSTSSSTTAGSATTAAPATTGAAATTVAGATATTAAGTPGSAATTAPGSASGTKTTIGYQLSWLPTVENCGTFIGIQDGIFAGLGLDVKVINGGPNVQTVPAVVSGSALIGSDGADNVGNGVANGAKVKIFGTRMQKNPLCVVSLAAKPITKPEDLIGKKIGVAQGNQAGWDVFLKRAGIDASKITVVPVQYDPSPVANGEVDGQVVFSINEPQQLKVKGVDTSILLFADYGFDIYAGCYFALEDTIKNDPDTLVAFLKGERAAFEKDFADPSLGSKYTVEIFGKDQGFDANQQLFESQVLPTVMVTDDTKASGLFTMTPAGIQANLDTLKVAGVDVTADMFTDEILKLM
jgi:ABC-type nitrate/sulfonate/bicarbonate transport system substrate-binding protein